MTPEQELIAHQLLDQKAAEMPTRVNPKMSAKARREAQKKIEAEAKALEAQRKAAAAAPVNFARPADVAPATPTPATASANVTPIAPVAPPITQPVAPIAPPITKVEPPVQPNVTAAPSEAEKAHEQALKNAAAAAKAQLEDQSKEQVKAVTPPLAVVPPVAPPPAAVPEPKAVVATPKPSAPPAPEPVPLPITGVKQQRLTQLLEAYKKDQLTPAQYHQERAKMLAEP
jgi:hypothetical protein